VGRRRRRPALRLRRRAGGVSDQPETAASGGRAPLPGPDTSVG
jgi:hypothetical protein